MLDFIKRKIYKRRFLRELRENIWTHEFMIAYDEELIPDIEKLIVLRQAEAEKLKEESKTFDANDHKRETRDRKKELEGKIANIEKEIGQYQSTVSSLRQNIETQKQKVAQIRHKTDFIREHC